MVYFSPSSFSLPAPRLFFPQLLVLFPAAGVGWGLIHAVIMVGTALSKHMGPGAAFSSSCPHVPSVVVSGKRMRARVTILTTTLPLRLSWLWDALVYCVLAEKIGIPSRMEGGDEKDDCGSMWIHTGDHFVSRLPRGLVDCFWPNCTGGSRGRLCG